MAQFHDITLRATFGSSCSVIAFGTTEQVNAYATSEANSCGATAEVTPLSQPRVHTELCFKLLERELSFFECTITNQHGSHDLILIGTESQATQYGNTEASAYGGSAHILRLHDFEIETLLPILDVSNL